MKIYQILNTMTNSKIEVTKDDLTVITIAELKVFIQESVSEAMKKHVCRIKADDKVVDEIPDFMNALRHIGEGDISRGTACIQENHRVMTKLRRRSDALAVKISNFILLAITGGILSALWLGIKQYIKAD